LLKLRSDADRDYISIEDPAVGDKDHWAEYIKSGFDAKYLGLVTSETPTVFKLRPLSRSQSVAIGITSGAAPRSAGQDDEIVAVGLRGVSNFPGVECVLKGNGDRERVDEATLNLIGKNIDLRHELATMIVRISSLSPLGV
jgi:hypothetical protein